MQALDDIAWLIVDDGSTDATAALAQDSGVSSRWRVVSLPSNVGKGEAVRKGFVDAVGAESIEGVGFMDADGAFDVDDVARLCGIAREAFAGESPLDAVWSSRVMLSGRSIRRSSRRHYLGRVIATYLSVGRDPLPYDTQSGLKFFAASSTLVRCLDRPFTTRWLFDLELLARWHHVAGTSMRIWEEPLHSWRDVPGSKIRGRELIRIAREVTVIRSLLAESTNGSAWHRRW